MAKTFNDTYLFSQYPDYAKEMIQFILKANEVDKKHASFEEVKIIVKRCRISNSFVKLLESKNVVLLIAEKPLAKSIKVFTAKDIRGENNLKTFIDCTGIISLIEGNYEVTGNGDKLVAYLLDAMVSQIYFADTKILFMNTTVVNKSTECFTSLFTHIIDYIGKISIVPGLKDKCEYMAAMYYQTNILGKDSDSDSVRALALKISGLSEREEDLIDMQIYDDAYENLRVFVKSVSKVLKIDKLSLDIVVEKWMYLYGPGTVFGLEMFPNFSSMITDSYVGCFINNQKTIEKVVGTPLVEYTKKILAIGADTL